MRSLYGSPVRVYLLLGVLAAAGLFSGSRLPVSLFPNSSKPVVGVEIPYGGGTADEFLNQNGRDIEEQLRSIATKGVEVERLEASYDPRSVYYELEFRWGTDPQEAFREVQSTVSALGARLPDESRDSIGVWMRNENSGFLAVSFFSRSRSLDDLYDVLEPLLAPKLAKVRDAQDPGLWNPSRREVKVELDPDAMAALGLLPRDIEKAVRLALEARGGGALTVGTQQLQIQMPRAALAPVDLARALVFPPAGPPVTLGEVAHVEVRPKTTDTKSFKTSGAPSLILFATPRAGGNVKRMAEELLRAVTEAKPQFPKDVEYRVLVDPSQFIREAVHNVQHEVLLGALLAVSVLFLFIGSLRNTVTAAIEIPLSMVLAFILMRFSGMNLNLISLGGLALSAGMNVDASVVVLENLFRHLELERGRLGRALSAAERLETVVRAVGEVRFAVIASTVASLVVFLPLAFTSELTYAVLGDLAKTVVFTHGLSAFVALLLVPTVRLHLMSRGRQGAEEAPHRPPIEKGLRRLEAGYARALSALLERPRLKWSSLAALAVAVPLLVALVLPRLPREIIGTPDTDMMFLSVNTKGNTQIRQMESQIEEIEAGLLRELGARIQYTFTQVRGPNRAHIMARLKNKAEMREVWKAMEARFVNTPFLSYFVMPWNPSELPIPDPPQVRVAIRGGTAEERAGLAQTVRDRMEEGKVLPRVWTEPGVDRREQIVLRPHHEQWDSLRRQGANLLPSDLADLARVATLGRPIGRMPVDGRLTEIVMGYRESSVLVPEDVGALPVGVAGRLIPLRALADVSLEVLPPTLYREDQRELALVLGKKSGGADEKDPGAAARRQAMEKLVADVSSGVGKGEGGAVAVLEDAERDLNEALEQLGWAVAISITLIFLTMVLQFGDPVAAGLVLVAVPLGFIGVLAALFVFGSTLSLNSALGVILLNGIAVANSIILVDFMKRRVADGLPPREAAVDAARTRLKPILITSLTTVLGMLPVALGLGAGGRILQPLGVAVTGGLWVSTLLTLFAVPALQVTYLEARSRRAVRGAASGVGAGASGWLPTGLTRLRELAQRRKGAAKALVVALTVFGGWGRGVPPARSEELAWDEVVRRSVDRDPDVALARADVDAGRARRKASRAAFLPELSASASQSAGGPVGGSAASVTNTRFVGGTSSWNLFRWGADVAAARAAMADLDRLEKAVDAAVLGAELGAVGAVADRIERRLEEGVRERVLKLQAEVLTIAEKRYGRGLLPQQEVDRVHVDYDNAAATLESLRARSAEAAAALEDLAGPGMDVKAEWAWSDYLKRVSGALLAKATVGERPWERSPAVAVARFREEGETARYHRSKRLLLPSLDAEAEVGKRFSSGAAVASSTTSWSGSVTLSIPLFEGLSDWSAMKGAEAERAKAERLLSESLEDARREWRAASEGFRIAVGTAAARERTAQLSRRIYRDDLRRFEAGRSTANDLAEEQRRLATAEVLEIQGWAEAHRAAARLCRSVGLALSACLAPAG